MSRLSKNIFYNLTGQIILLSLGFVAVKYIFKQLGEDALGIIYFTAMLNSIFCAVLEMGICSTTIREVSTYMESEPWYIKELIRTFSSFYWTAYVLLGLAIYFLSPVLVEKWIHLKTMDAATATHILRILGICSLLALPKSFYNSLFSGLQRMEFNNLIDVLTSGLQQLGTIVILIFIRGNVFLVIYWFAACYVLGTLAYIILAGRLFSPQALIPGFSFSIIRKNWGFSSRMMFITITAVIYAQVDKLTISKFLLIGMIGYYGVAYNTAFKGVILAGSISQAAYPSFSNLFRQGERDKMMSQYRKLQDLLCFGFVPILAIIPFASLPVFSYVLNIETAKLLLLPTILLCVGFYMNITLSIPGVFSFAAGKPGIAARQQFYDLFVTIPATVILIYYFGLIGAGLSLIFSQVFRYLYALPRICKECLSIPTNKWYLHILMVFALTGSTYGLAWTTLRFLGFYSVFSLSLAYACASGIFLVGSYFMIGDELRESLSGHIQILKRKIICKRSIL